MIQNPILRGFNPDPSIVRVAEDYYIATSTFEWFPGVQIHHSRDLKNWRLLTHVLTRQLQLDMVGNPDSCGVWAPCLTYDGGLFYLIYTDVKSRLGAFKDTHNYLVTSENIEGPWSDSIYLNSSGFDPSLFHDDDGRKWLVNMLWDYRAKGRKTFAGIVLQEYCVRQKKLIGNRKNIFLGTSLQVTEGPHLYKRNGFYYLMTAEGGTEYGHAVTMARSSTIDGPYEIDPKNPILTSAGHEEWPLQKAGHGCLVQTPNDEWAMVHLVGRPIKDKKCVLGRETAIQRMEWTNEGWLQIEGGGNTPHLDIQEFKLDEQSFPKEPEIDHFNSPTLNIHWSSLRVPPDSTWVSLTERQGYLRIRGRESLSSLHRQSLIGRRQQSIYCEAETELEFEPEHFQQMAGMILYYDTKDYVYLRISRDERLGKFLGIVRSVNGVIESLSDSEVSIDGTMRCRLKVVIEAEYAQFYYSLDDREWHQIGSKLDILHLSDESKIALRFTGNFIGLCAQDLSGTRKHVDFDYFRYTELD
ncbi:glycoside hydrolase family 43 protein [Cohnella cholangitidis]|uniref:Family 43 glycosylhydrolase n=1 Tax=Cohnella cholangitidis TaxID=2598458 RepID=A0A7G5C455_9BACL|nr:glycoside hydrolase family 43 protein [Cohnella cholangitidis]QMV43989.1 family 43 glycosylhydrolase [Cohnella cholangitidis]